ncbi:Protein of unknown function [Kytococcus aerolatus]|uniref:DUF3180 domain-containing protein n=1 Tax=Kytococcus aerolatus TaxID=592308 RepID=A0A212U655_9MICO|nr:DUF3180 family protein [Kytococcus aerolatus]SNC73733.1 Protein of unknown function [Kytococcus aerolatus]
MTRDPRHQTPTDGPQGPGTRPWQLVLTWLGASLVGWGLSTWWLGRGNPVPVRAGAGLVLDLLFAGALLAAALWVWRSSRTTADAAADQRWRERSPAPTTARLVVVLAIAAAWAGASLAGLFTGLLVAALPNADVPSVRGDVLRTGLQVGTSVVLAVVGQVSQWLCRVPPEGEDDHDGGRGQRVTSPSTPAMGRYRDDTAA